MISALIDSTDTVVNMIVADPRVDPTPEGFLMIGDPPNFVNTGTKWDPAAGIFIEPELQPSSPIHAIGLVMI